MPIKLVTAPTTYPVTLAEAKLHCRVDTSDDDALITALITAATEMAEQKTGRAIMQQTWDLTLDEFADTLELTRVPVQTVTHVKYYDTDAVQQTLSSALYAVSTADDFAFGKITPLPGTEWPAIYNQPDAVTVRYVSGYANAAAVPEGIKQWVKLMISTMYDNRETESYSSRAVSTTVQMSFVDRLLDRYNVYSL
jgi:uncharacterized phiE125 gp8 family phage protein